MLLAVLAALLVMLPPPLAAAEKALVYHLEGRPASLDPVMASSEREYHVVWHLCDALLNISKDGRSLEPGLAESWLLSADGREAVVKLRQGASFHDGSAVDATAVRASVERYLTPTQAVGGGQGKPIRTQTLEELVASVEVQDLRTLAFKLKYPGFHYLSQIEVANPQAAARLGKEFGRRPDCSGPFKFESWTEDRIALVANERYWGGRPRIDRLIFRVIEEGKAVADALLRQEIDFSPAVPDPTVLERLRDSQRVKLVPMPGLNVFYLGFYTERPPFNDPTVRRALVHAINVPRTAQFLGRGTVTPAQGPLPPAIKGHDPSAAQAAYDPEAARELLRRAGLGTGLTVGLVHNAAAPFQGDLAGAIRNDLKRVGITVELAGKPGWRDVVNAARAREGHLFIYGFYVRAPYAERLLVPLFHSRSVGTSGLTHYRNATVDRLLDEAVRTPDAAVQQRLYAQVQQVLVEEAPMVFLYHLSRMAAHSLRMKGLELNLGVLPHDKLVRTDVTP
jgi:peptide/nickel transport system substrate-binding protein